MLLPGPELVAAFEENLNHWLAQAVEPPAELPPNPKEPAFLRLYEERLKRLQTYLDKAERDAEQALVPLTNDIEAIQRWLNNLNAARARMAERMAEV